VRTTRPEPAGNDAGRWRDRGAGRGRGQRRPRRSRRPGRGARRAPPGAASAPDIDR